MRGRCSQILTESGLKEERCLSLPFDSSLSSASFSLVDPFAAFFRREEEEKEEDECAEEDTLIEVEENVIERETKN